MSLTPAQQTALGNDIAVNNIQVGGVAIKDLPHTADNAYAVAAWYNTLTTTPFYGNYRAVPLSLLKGCINWKRLTPTDTPDGTQTWANRSLACQGAQFNVQLLFSTGSNTTLDATQASVVQGLNDALSAVPSGVGGANQDAGWTGTTGVKQNICRLATNAEKLFADTTSANGSARTAAATFTFEGVVTPDDIRAIWGL